MTDLVKPMKLWCTKCPQCAHFQIMETIASTYSETSLEKCEDCGTEYWVKLPITMDEYFL